MLVHVRDNKTSIFFKFYYCFLSRSHHSAMEVPLLDHESPSLSGATGHRSLFSNAGLFSNMTFSWMGPLLDLGKRKTLDLNDVPFLDDCDSVHGIIPKFRSKIASISAAGQ